MKNQKTLRFIEIIDFPPLPISLDYDLLGKNADILIEFERGKVYSLEELGEFDEKLKVFFTEVQVDGQKIFELNAIGQLYLTSFRLRYPQVVQLRDLQAQEKEEPNFGNDHHYPIGFKEFVNKVWRENQWIKTCHSLPYAKQKAIKGISFRVEKENEKSILVGTYKDKNNFKARFRIVLSEESIESLNYAAEYLNRKYG